ncbi:hypothetical protein [Streptococcus equinus]|uniref:hypothetical protein n=1 Tax=Streptococcus equinus TaxID=1335 RepID=UPI0003F4E546|nr:hypothetical protein [Streptococcus equinus]
MNRDIKLIYIDDKIDLYLDEYLDKLDCEKNLFRFKDFNFNSNKDNYRSLIESKEVKESDIIVIDSKLFENANVASDSKFTGEEFRLISKTSNPFREVIVISQNDNLNHFGVLKKFDTKKGHSSSEDAEKFYDAELLPILKSTIKLIEVTRNSIQEMIENKESYKDSLIVEKAHALIDKIPSYKDLTDDKINELIDFVKGELMD